MIHFHNAQTRTTPTHIINSVDNSNISTLKLASKTLLVIHNNANLIKGNGCLHSLDWTTGLSFSHFYALLTGLILNDHLDYCQ